MSQSHRPDLVNSHADEQRRLGGSRGEGSQSHRPDLVNSHVCAWGKILRNGYESRNPTVLIWSIPTFPVVRDGRALRHVAIPPS